MLAWRFATARNRHVCTAVLPSPEPTDAVRLPIVIDIFQIVEGEERQYDISAIRRISIETTSASWKKESPKYFRRVFALDRRRRTDAGSNASRHLCNAAGRRHRTSELLCVS
jgi:hypothetical protein